MRNLDDKIPGAQNFKYGEFTKSMTAIRLGISNLPSAESEWVAIERLAVNILQPLRIKFGRIIITSGYRNPTINKLIGGSIISHHCYGQAADIEPIEIGVTLFDILEYIYTTLDYTELIAEYFPNGWVHVAYCHDSNLKELKLKDKSHNYDKINFQYLSNLYKK